METSILLALSLHVHQTHQSQISREKAQAVHQALEQASSIKVALTALTKTLQAHLPTENLTTILCSKLRSSRIVTTLLSLVATKNARKRKKTTKKVAMLVKKTPLSAIPWTKWTLKNQWSTILQNVMNQIQWGHRYPQLHTLQSLVFLTAHPLPSTANHQPPRNDIPQGEIKRIPSKCGICISMSFSWYSLSWILFK